MSKITRKSYKRKKIILGAALFGGIGLVSTGFAAWVLTNQATVEQGMTMSVGEVTDNNMAFENIKVYDAEGTEVTQSPIFSFEPAKDDNKGRVQWNGVEYENLILTVKGELTSAQSLANLYAQLDWVSGGAVPDGEDYANGVLCAKGKNYIDTPEAFGTEKLLCSVANEVRTEESDKFVIDTDASTSTKLVFSYTVEFTWGDLFGNDNPSVYYDDTNPSYPQGKGTDEAHADTVAGKLKGLRACLNGVSLKLTLTAKPNN